MKRTFIAGVIALTLFAGAAPRLAAERVSLEVKGAYFLPTEQVFRDVYGGGPAYGAEIGVGLMAGLSLWAGADYFTKKGQLTFTGEDTEITLMPVSGGLRYTLGAGRLRPYVGAGVVYVKYKETSVIGTVDKGDVGFLGQVGVRFKVAGGFFLDVQARYSVCKAKPGDVTADLGGLQAGLGLGIAF
jgi:outer membrane protein W